MTHLTHFSNNPRRPESAPPPRVACHKCGSTRVGTGVAIQYLIYYRCNECFETWTDASTSNGRDES